MKHANHVRGLEALQRKAESGASSLDVVDLRDPFARAGGRRRTTLGQRMGIRVATGRHPLAQ